jgi:hypothetical protein
MTGDHISGADAERQIISHFAMVLMKGFDKAVGI